MADFPKLLGVTRFAEPPTFNGRDLTSPVVRNGMTVRTGDVVVEGGDLRLVNGTLTLDTGGLTVTAGDLTVTAGVVKIPDGTAAAPALTFGDNIDTGVYSTNTNEVAFSSGGGLAWMMKRVSDESRLYGRETNDYLVNDNVAEEWRFMLDSTEYFTVDKARTQVVNGSFFGLPVKTTTGDPGSPQNGDMYVNTADNALRLYADAAWRSVVTW